MRVAIKVTSYKNYLRLLAGDARDWEDKKPHSRDKMWNTEIAFAVSRGRAVIVTTNK